MEEQNIDFKLLKGTPYKILKYIYTRESVIKEDLFAAMALNTEIRPTDFIMVFDTLLESEILREENGIIYITAYGKKIVRFLNQSFMDVSPIQLLDKTLAWFAMDIEEMGLGLQLSPRINAKEDTFLPLMAAKFKELNTPEFLTYSDLVLRKLINDKHLDFNKERNLYSITFDGKFFSKAGGYAQKAKDEVAYSSHQAKVEDRNYWTSFFVAFGTVGVVVIEILKIINTKFHWW